VKLKTWCAEHRRGHVEVARSLHLPGPPLADRLIERNRPTGTLTFEEFLAKRKGEKSP
jgi:hypothetical protein